MNQAERSIKRMSEYAAIGLVTIETIAQLKCYIFTKAILSDGSGLERDSEPYVYQATVSIDHIPKRNWFMPYKPANLFLSGMILDLFSKVSRISL